jgi:hypothetical protein
MFTICYDTFITLNAQYLVVHNQALNLIITFLNIV